MTILLANGGQLDSPGLSVGGEQQSISKLDSDSNRIANSFMGGHIEAEIGAKGANEALM